MLYFTVALKGHLQTTNFHCYLSRDKYELYRAIIAITYRAINLYYRTINPYYRAINFFYRAIIHLLSRDKFLLSRDKSLLSRDKSAIIARYIGHYRAIIPYSTAGLRLWANSCSKMAAVVYVLCFLLCLPSLWAVMPPYIPVSTQHPDRNSLIENYFNLGIDLFSAIVNTCVIQSYDCDMW